MATGPATPTTRPGRPGRFQAGPRPRHAPHRLTPALQGGLSPEQVAVNLGKPDAPSSPTRTASSWAWRTIWRNLAPPRPSWAADAVELPLSAIGTSPSESKATSYSRPLGSRPDAWQPGPVPAHPPGTLLPPAAHPSPDHQGLPGRGRCPPNCWLPSLPSGAGPSPSTTAPSSPAGLHDLGTQTFFATPAPPGRREAWRMPTALRNFPPPQDRPVPVAPRLLEQVKHGAVAG